MRKLSPEEAAKVLEDMKVKIEIPKAAVTQWKRNTALDMAIEALKYSEVPNSSDCISRWAAIEEFDEAKVDEENCTEYEIGYNDGIDFAVSTLSVLPSIQPKRGEWTEKEVSDSKAIEEWQSAKCSACGKYHTTPYMYYFSEYNYCPNCGARMTEGGEDEVN